MIQFQVNSDVFQKDAGLRLNIGGGQLSKDENSFEKAQQDP